MYAEAKAKVALPVATVWNRLTDLRALSQWAPDVASSPAEPLRAGATRWARLYEPVYGKDVLVERFTDVDARRHCFTYDIEGGIGPLTMIQTTWRVEPDGEGSVVTCSSLLTITGPARFLSFLVLRRWTAQLQALVDGFVRWAKDLEGDAEVMDGPEPSFPDPAPQEEAIVELREREPQPVVKAKAKVARGRPKAVKAKR